MVGAFCNHRQTSYTLHVCCKEGIEHKAHNQTLLTQGDRGERGDGQGVVPARRGAARTQRL